MPSHFHHSAILNQLVTPRYSLTKPHLLTGITLHHIADYIQCIIIANNEIVEQNHAFIRDLLHVLEIKSDALLILDEHKLQHKTISHQPLVIGFGIITAQAVKNFTHYAEIINPSLASHKRQLFQQLQRLLNDHH